MQARMKNPAAIVPGAMEAIQALMASVQKTGTPPAVLHLVHLRASQINGCSPCVDGGVKHAKQAGETDERLFAVAAWGATRPISRTPSARRWRWPKP